MNFIYFITTIVKPIAAIPFNHVSIGSPWHETTTVFFKRVISCKIKIV